MVELTPRQAQAAVLLEVFIDLMHQLGDQKGSDEPIEALDALQREDIAMLAKFFDRLARDRRPTMLSPDSAARLARLLRLWAGTNG